MTTYRLRANGTIPGETFSFGLHVVNNAGTTAGAAAAWHTALGLLWNGTGVTDQLVASYTNQVSIVDSDAVQLDAVTGHNVTSVQTAETLTGTAVSEMLPHEVAVVVSLRSATPTRQGRGRFYLPPPAVSVVSTGRLAAVTKGRFVTAAQKMVQSLNGAGYTVVIKHPDQTTTTVTRVDVGDVFDVQERRRKSIVEARTALSV